jgi:hypothetical protein
MRSRVQPPLCSRGGVWCEAIDNLTSPGLTWRMLFAVVNVPSVLGLRRLPRWAETSDDTHDVSVMATEALHIRPARLQSLGGQIVWGQGGQEHLPAFDPT